VKVIANIGFNWWTNKGDSKDRAEQLVKTAFNAGADGICVPYFKAEKVHRVPNVVKQMGKFNIEEELLYDLKQMADKLAKDFYVAPSHVDDVGYLETIMVDKFHVENGNTSYTPLLERLAEREVLLSTGFSTFGEIDDAAEILLGSLTPSESELILLHSTGKLPTPAHEVQLRRVLDLATEFFPLYVGVESFFHDRLFDFVSMAYDPAVFMRRIDLDDGEGIESLYSLSPEQFGHLVRIGQLMDKVNNPEFYDKEFVEGDFEARINKYRCAETNYTLPPES
jgi:sialic acid synthase SpsE